MGDDSLSSLIGFAISWVWFLLMIFGVLLVVMLVVASWVLWGMTVGMVHLVRCMWQGLDDG